MNVNYEMVRWSNLVSVLVFELKKMNYMSLSELGLDSNMPLDMFVYLELEKLVEPILSMNVLSLFSIFVCMLAVTSMNTMMSVLYLMLLFVLVAYYLMYMGMMFMGIAYMIMYIGAISMLFLFILMMLDMEFTSLNLKDNSKMMPLLSMLGSLIFSTMYLTLPSSNSFIDVMLYMLYMSVMYMYSMVSYVFMFSSSDGGVTGNFFENFIKDFDSFKYNCTDVLMENKDYLNVTLNNAWDMHMSSVPQVDSLGIALYSNYWVWLMLVSMILILSIMTVITLTVPKMGDQS